MRSLLDVEHSLETARQGTEVGNSEDRRIDQVVSVLEQYEVVVGALQETKWFRSEVYMVGESVASTAGRNVPGIGHVKQREGVAIVLIMRQQHHRMCWDVTVMRGAECNTDHQMLRMRLLVGHRRMICRRVKAGKNAKRFDVKMLQGRSEDDKGRETTRDVFQRMVSDRARELWREKGTVEKWGTVKTALCETAEAVLDFEKRK